MPIARRLGDRADRRNLDGSDHRSRREADPSTWSQAMFDCCLPCVLGWMILVGVRPMLGSVDALTALLIGVGGLLYSIGVGFHLWRALPFHTQYGTASCWSHQLSLRSYSEWRGLGTMRSGGIYRCYSKRASQARRKLNLSPVCRPPLAAWSRRPCLEGRINKRWWI